MAMDDVEADYFFQPHFNQYYCYWVVMEVGAIRNSFLTHEFEGNKVPLLYRKG